MSNIIDLDVALRASVSLPALVRGYAAAFNTFAWSGTSRLASQYLDIGPEGGLARNKSNSCWINWMAAKLRMMSKPITTLGNFATSGFRSDQFDAGLEKAIGTGAREQGIDGPVNDFAHCFPTILTGSIDGTTLTITAYGSGPGVKVGGVVTGTGVAANTTIVSQLSGDPGRVGTYQVSTAQTVASTAITTTGYTTIGGATPGVYVTFANVAAVAMANMRKHFRRILDAGARIWYVFERGANSNNASFIGAVNDYNRMVADFIERGDDVRGPPNVIVLDPTPYSVVTGTTASIQLKPTGTQDGTHDNTNGSRVIGFAFAEKAAPYLRELPGHRLRTTTQKSGNGTRNLLANPTMTGSVAATGTGNTGNLPTGYTASAGSAAGGVTSAFTIQATSADGDGNTWGNELKVEATATAAGKARVVIALDRGLLVGGDNVKGGLEVDVVQGATGLGGVSADLEWFPTTGGSAPMYDLISSGLGTDPGGYTIALEPDPLRILPGYTGSPFCNLVFEMAFTGAGSATAIIRKPWAERVPGS